MADKEIIKALFSHYGIRSYHEKNGRFYNIDACIMKHLRQDIREVRKNIDFQKKCVEAVKMLCGDRGPIWEITS